jgi:glyoxylase-like metal-dependent hydrolase (beta-lactamase superfamily II)
MPAHRLAVGNVEVLGLTDQGPVDYDPFPLLNQLFPNVSLEAWAPYQQRYPEVFGGPNIWRTHYGCYLLRSQGRTILVDTGAGSAATNPGMIAFFGLEDGRLMSELHSAGVHPEDIDMVFFTHLHPDHVGWNLSQSGSRVMFPKARYVINQADWDTFGTPEFQEQFPIKFWEETLGPLEKLGVLDLITGEQALTDEIMVISTPGHTPGHMSLAIVSGGERALVMGDVAIHPAQLTEVDWGHIFEMDQALAAQTRRQFLDRVEAENAILVACHFPSPGFGKLVRVEGHRYWQGL